MAPTARTARAPTGRLLGAALLLAGCAHRPCAAPTRDLRGAWDRAALVAAMNEVPGGRPGKLAALDDLDRLARAWTDARTNTCDRRTPSTRASLEARIACQDLARDALAAIARRLSHPSAGDLDRAPAAALAARRLLTACDRPAVAALLSDPASRELVAPAVALALADPAAAELAARAEQTLRTGSDGQIRPERPAIAVQSARAGSGDRPEQTLRTGSEGHAVSDMSVNFMTRRAALADLARLLRGWAHLAIGRPDEAAALADLPPEHPLHPFARELLAAARPSPTDRAAARDGCAQWLGDAHPRCAAVDVELALHARAAGDDPTAVRLLTRAHAIFRAEDPASDASHDVALHLGDLARVRGDPLAALEHHRLVLDHRRRRRGDHHLATAEALHAVGADLEALHRLDEAAIHYQRAAVIRQDRAPDDPVTARTYNNLGRLCYLRGDLEDARRFHLAALQIRRLALGEEHPDTATSYNNLGAVDLAEGDVDAALRHFTRAREIRERTLGPEHPYLAVSLHNLAEVHALRGDLPAAEALYARALQIRRARFGEDHPETARTRHALGGLALRRGDHETATRELSAALAAFGKTLGLDHPETRRALARLREAQAAPPDMPSEPASR